MPSGPVELEAPDYLPDSRKSRIVSNPNRLDASSEGVAAPSSDFNLSVSGFQDHTIKVLLSIVRHLWEASDTYEPLWNWFSDVGSQQCI